MNGSLRGIPFVKKDYDTSMSPASGLLKIRLWLCLIYLLISSLAVNSLQLSARYNIPSKYTHIMPRHHNQYSQIPTALQLEPFLKEYRKLGLEYKEMKDILAEEQNITIS